MSDQHKKFNRLEKLQKTNPLEPPRRDSPTRQAGERVNALNKFNTKASEIRNELKKVIEIIEANKDKLKNEVYFKIFYANCKAEWQDFNVIQQEVSDAERTGGSVGGLAVGPLNEKIKKLETLTKSLDAGLNLFRRENFAPKVKEIKNKFEETTKFIKSNKDNLRKEHFFWAFQANFNEDEKLFETIQQKFADARRMTVKSLEERTNKLEALGKSLDARLKLLREVHKTQANLVATKTYIGTEKEILTALMKHKPVKNFVFSFQQQASDDSKLARHYLEGGGVHPDTLSEQVGHLEKSMTILEKTYNEVQEYLMLRLRLKLEDAINAIEGEMKKVSFNLDLCKELEEGGYTLIDEKLDKSLYEDSKNAIKEGREYFEMTKSEENPQSLLDKSERLDTLCTHMSNWMKAFKKELIEYVPCEYTEFSDKAKELVEEGQILRMLSNVKINVNKEIIENMGQFWSEHGIKLTFDQNKSLTLEAKDIPPTSPMSLNIYNAILWREFWNIDTLDNYCNMLNKEYSKQFCQENATKEEQKNLEQKIRNCEKQKEDLLSYKEVLKKCQEKLIARDNLYVSEFSDMKANRSYKIDKYDIYEFNKYFEKCKMIREKINKFIKNINEIFGENSGLSKLDIVFKEMDTELSKSVINIASQPDKLYENLLKISYELGYNGNPFFLEYEVHDHNEPVEIELIRQVKDECGLVAMWRVLSSRNEAYLEDWAKIEEFLRVVVQAHQELLPDLHIDTDGNRQEPDDNSGKPKYNIEDGSCPQIFAEILEKLGHRPIYEFLPDVFSSKEAAKKLELKIGQYDDEGRIIPVFIVQTREAILPWEEGLLGHGVLTLNRIKLGEEDAVVILDSAMDRPYAVKMKHLFRWASDAVIPKATDGTIGFDS